MKDRFLPSLFCIILPIFSVLLIMNIILSSFDKKVWDNVDKHLDEFVYDHTTSNTYHKFILYDKDSTYVCEILLNSSMKYSAVFDDMELVASSVNKFRSGRVYKKLIQRVPEENIYRYKKDETLKKFEKMKKQ